MAQQGLYITVYALLFVCVCVCVCVMCLFATDKDYLTLSLSQQIIFSGTSRRLPCMLCQGSPLSPVIKGVWALLCNCSLINVNHCRLPLGQTSVLHLYSKNLYLLQGSDERRVRRLTTGRSVLSLALTPNHSMAAGANVRCL